MIFYCAFVIYKFHKTLIHSNEHHQWHLLINDAFCLFKSTLLSHQIIYPAIFDYSNLDQTPNSPLAHYTPILTLRQLLHLHIWPNSVIQQSPMRLTFLPICISFPFSHSMTWMIATFDEKTMPIRETAEKSEQKFPWLFVFGKTVLSLEEKMGEA